MSRTNTKIATALAASMLLLAETTAIVIAESPTSAGPYLTDIQQHRDTVSLTVFPVDLPKLNDKQLGFTYATGVALVLERSGVKHIQVAKDVVPLASRDGRDIDALAREFSIYVSTNKIATDYAYLTQFIGTRQTGPEFVLTVVVSKQGDIVWRDAEGPKDSSFKRYHPTDPLGCAFVSVEKFSKAADLLDIASPNAPKGQWYQYFQNRKSTWNPTDSPRAKGPLLVKFIVIIGLIAIWDAVWRLIAMWKCGRHSQLAWFICLAIFNTAGILPIIYIVGFQKSEPLVQSG